MILSGNSDGFAGKSQFLGLRNEINSWRGQCFFEIKSKLRNRSWILTKIKKTYLPVGPLGGNKGQGQALNSSFYLYFEALKELPRPFAMGIETGSIIKIRTRTKGKVPICQWDLEEEAETRDKVRQVWNSSFYLYFEALKGLPRPFSIRSRDRNLSSKFKLAQKANVH